MSALRLRNITKRHGGRAVLEGVTLEVATGAFHGLVGPSGAGKTTLLRIAAGLDEADSGRVESRGKIGMVFQDLGLWPHMPALEHIRFVLGSDANDAMEWLERVNLAGRARARPAELSGGERQRLALARALAPGPAVLLLDEPFKSLDEPAAARLARELRELSGRTGTTTLLVSHARAEALALCERIAFLDAGRLLHDGPPESLLSPGAPGAVREFFDGLTANPPGSRGSCEVED